MKTRYYAFLIIAMLSCVDNNVVQPTKEFRVEIIGKVPFCTLTIIEFQPEDLKDLERITGQIGELRCQTSNLPENLNQTGQRLYVTIRNSIPEEYPVCNTLGPGFTYPLVTIINVMDN
jgi:hypothetical protein